MAGVARAGYTPDVTNPIPDNGGAYLGRVVWPGFVVRAGYTSAITSGGGFAVPPPSVLLDLGGVAMDPANPSFMVPLL